MIKVKNEKIAFDFLKNGAVRAIHADSFMINQSIGNNLDGSIGNIYLRIVDERGNYHSRPLMGPRSGSDFYVAKNKPQAKWQGSFMSVDYTLSLRLGSKSWFWHIALNNPEQKTCDLFYTQDLGLALPGTVMSNEAYVSQYIDHKIVDDQVLSRQNQAQDGSYPALQEGALSTLDSYSTDGYQFYGLDYRRTNIPRALEEAHLLSQNYQYEFALTALKSPITSTAEYDYTFYACYDSNHPEQITECLLKKNELREEFAAISVSTDWQLIGEGAFLDFGYLSGEQVGSDFIKEHFPERCQSEKIAGDLAAFFTPAGDHVVLQNKEMVSERPTGNIILSNLNYHPKSRKLATTAYMSGVFNSQIVFGNTSNNKFVTNARNSLNVLKNSGQRIYLKRQGKWNLLGLPSVFEMGINFNKWVYELSDDRLVVTTYTSGLSDQVVLEFQAQKKYDILVTTQVGMGDVEYQDSFNVTVDSKGFEFSPKNETPMAQHNPAISYTLRNQSVASARPVAMDKWLFNVDSADQTLFGLEFKQVNSFQLTMAVTFNESELPVVESEAKSIQLFQETYHHLLGEIQLSALSNADPRISDQIEKMNLITYWYAHDAMIHLLSPHGLEQYGGAAWGTRDVCQGPLEFFIATRNFDYAREIILTVYAHQQLETGNWPQWFMFDEYEEIFSDESHGDVIVWPMKALAAYLKATGDISILDEKISWFSAKQKRTTEKSGSLFDHLQQEINYIRDHFFKGTVISEYGDGDWDDTLQPANAADKKRMASTWTVELTYQALTELNSNMSDYDPDFYHLTTKLIDQLKRQFRKYFEPQDILPGFISFEADGTVRKIIHPDDSRTGINYRLLPMTRGILSHLLNEEEINQHLQIIRKELIAPDAVRLMSAPAEYQGGVSHIFKRAEQAANFGREIGLAYIHANIRFIEALSELHDQSAWDFAQRIIPINIKNEVENAAPRQANAYFSSSDADFMDRYAARKDFAKIKAGKVPVKGGWKIYSSGPGIFLSTIFTKILGIRIQDDKIIIDPVIPDEIWKTGLLVSLKVFEKTIKIKYLITTDESTNNEQKSWFIKDLRDGETLVIKK
ncbi:GH36-type glycosyl hydrolase domain-containing protein [Lapidilactobacillus luobeiensis]|uniref:GH36-type glycosyl hydrolase domain-containing protein n=1 Tax=Lapidilactobacillus luobeiensis TaxID=2950371 RepID=UPI0021C2CD99|nr:cellobiose phosphorylase [Lapidilactobacillus luobeiensis]